MTDNVISSSMRDQEVLGHILKLKSNNPCHSNRRLTENETSCFCTTDDNNKTQQGKIYIHTYFGMLFGPSFYLPFTPYRHAELLTR